MMPGKGVALVVQGMMKTAEFYLAWISKAVSGHFEEPLDGHFHHLYRPSSGYSYIININCCQRKFHTLTMNNWLFALILVYVSF